MDDKRLTAELGTPEFWRQLLAIAEGSDHPNDVAIARILRRHLANGQATVKANDFWTVGMEIVTGDEVVVSEAELDRMLRREYERGLSDGEVSVFARARKLRWRRILAAREAEENPDPDAIARARLLAGQSEVSDGT